MRATISHDERVRSSREENAQGVSVGVLSFSPSCARAVSTSCPYFSLRTSVIISEYSLVTPPLEAYAISVLFPLSFVI